MTRTDIINQIIAKCGYTSYLEIGVQYGLNFHAIQCEEKIGVDPEPFYTATYPDAIYRQTSDDFFKRLHHQCHDCGFAKDVSEVCNKCPKKFDLIFIDGLHTAEQVKRDFQNAFKFLSAKGTIVMHDCNPPNEPCQRVPRETSEWTGDVWKAWVQIVDEYGGFCINTDYGVGVYSRSATMINEQYYPCSPSHIVDLGALTYQVLEQHRERTLNLISTRDFTEAINQ